MMTCYRYCRTEYIGSRCTQGFIAVHCRPGALHCRRDCPRTGGRELDRRCACEEEAAKGRFHLQVRATPHTPLHPPFFFLPHYWLRRGSGYWCPAVGGRLVG